MKLLNQWSFITSETEKCQFSLYWIKSKNIINPFLAMQNEIEPNLPPLKWQMFYFEKRMGWKLSSIFLLKGRLMW